MIKKIIKSKNSEVLNSFIRYAKKHPQERFWQALRNWSGEPAIVFYYGQVTGIATEGFNGFIRDTFYLEGKK